MNFIEFTKEHLQFNEEKQNYCLEIPKEEVGFKIESIQMVNNDGSFVQADCEITEDPLKFIILLDFPAHLRVNF